MSHPVWVRGLKHAISVPDICLRKVAPRVGAWIETHPIGEPAEEVRRSHPVWVRGLKLSHSRQTQRGRSRTPCGCVD